MSLSLRKRCLVLFHNKVIDKKMGDIIKKSFPVLNMHCAGCANNVEKSVRHLAGVKESSVNFASNLLLVSYDSEQQTPESIRLAVVAAGYDLIVNEDHMSNKCFETFVVMSGEPIH